MKRSTLICLVLALALAVMPLLAGCAAKDNRVVARVGDREITMQQFTNAYRNNEAYAVYYGYDLSTDEGLADFQDYILDQLINSEMLLYQADQAGKYIANASAKLQSRPLPSGGSAHQMGKDGGNKDQGACGRRNRLIG